MDPQYLPKQDAHRDQFIKDRDCAFDDSLNCYKEIDTWLLKLSTGAFVGVAITDQLSDTLTDSLFGNTSLVLFATSICMSLWCKIYAYNTLQKYRDLLDDIYRKHPTDYMPMVDTEAGKLLNNRHAFQDDLLRYTVAVVVMAVVCTVMAFLYN